jgi:hypothetical protein
MGAAVGFRPEDVETPVGLWYGDDEPVDWPLRLSLPCCLGGCTD